MKNTVITLLLVVFLAQNVLHSQENKNPSLQQTVEEVMQEMSELCPDASNNDAAYKILRCENKGEKLSILLSLNPQFQTHCINEYWHEELIEHLSGMTHGWGITNIDVRYIDADGEERVLSDIFSPRNKEKTVYQTPPNKDNAPPIAGNNAKGYGNPNVGQTQANGALSGKTVWLSGGHGWLYYTTLGYYSTQRDNSAGFGLVEDFGNIESVNYYLLKYLWNAGAQVWTVRERDLQEAELILDNDQGAPNYVESGTWTQSVSTGYNGGTYKYVYTTSTETATATYTPNIPQAGYYWISVHYLNGTNRPIDAHYRIQHAGGETLVSINQEVHGSTWVYLGQFYFDAGTNGKIILSNQSSDVGQALIADAVRIGGGLGDEADCDYGYVNNEPRFEQASRYYAPYQGYPTCENDVVTRPHYAEWELAKGTATEQANACFISWHTNACCSGTGTETIMYNGVATPGSMELRDFVHDELIYDIQNDWDAAWVDRGKKAMNLGELRELSTMPGALVEVGFHDNSYDTNYLLSPGFRNVAARAVYQGIVKFFADKDGITPKLLPEPPTHLYAKNIGNGEIQLSWNTPPSGGALGDAATSYKVYIGTHGKAFADGITVNGNTYTVSGLMPNTTYYFRLSALNNGGESFPTAIVAARTPDACSNIVPYLIVDGFDRLDKSAAVKVNETKPTAAPLGLLNRLFLEKMNSFDYMVEHAKSLEFCGLTFDGASNEAVSGGNVVLADYEAIDWITGEESTIDKSLDSTEKSLLSTFLDNGGNLLISGAEIGWDIGRSASPNADLAFYNNYLKATYVGDDANTYNFSGIDILAGISGGFDGTYAQYYNAEYPDRLGTTGGSTKIMNYSGGTADGAAVKYKGTFGVVNFGFPLETITDASVRNNIFAEVTTFLTPKPVASFSADMQTICVNETVHFTDTSTDNILERCWEFEGGSPATSSDANPNVIYTTAGTYWVKLKVFNAGGADSTTLTAYITVQPDTDGDGICDPDDNCVNTPNPLQEDADNNGVGDACESSGCEPFYVITINYASGETAVYEASDYIEASNIIAAGANVVYHAGDYIDLQPEFLAETAAFFEAVIQGCTAGAKTDNIALQSANTAAISLKIYPQPAHNEVFIHLENVPENTVVSWRVFDLKGAIVQEKSNLPYVAKGLELPVADWQNGMYLLQVQIDDVVYNTKFVVQKF
ncbi:MAG: fibronectin type III domain-containing protein [Chitinophagales bacterium]|nr:fibronectin type III domain-containing protein [Bacteroidota bacterium]MCB9042805.1 fibronectin type III domain-containing protein [Chitinophagales bacterium]